MMASQYDPNDRVALNRPQEAVTTPRRSTCAVCDALFLGADGIGVDGGGGERAWPSHFCTRAGCRRRRPPRLVRLGLTANLVSEPVRPRRATSSGIIGYLQRQAGNGLR